MTSQHFNNLTPKQAELLAMLAEECGEVVQIVGKILRHGLANFHPDNPPESNRQLLQKEMTDLYAVMSMMQASYLVNPIDYPDINHAALKKLKYAHHQTETTNG